MEVTEFAHSLYNKLRPEVSADEIRETFQNHLNFIDTELAQADSQLQEKKAELEAIHQENIASLNAARDEVVTGLAQLEGGESAG